ncbi:MAG: transcriptional repressor NrdR [Actinobacteria bacterium]|nr:transcriptional repressor NrdR [Actinomycetota bacterium]
MKCPFCGNKKTKVIDSRAIEEGSSIRRRRHCQKCDSRFTTFERREKIEVVVLKRSGAREPYDREKIVSGFRKACSKRNVSETTIENKVDEIEEEIMKYPDKEIPAADIGNMVMEKLKNLDEIAYLRFVSVYKRFGDVSEFEKELGELSPKQFE